jgi:uncharacterized protein YjiS (DUF1127 family)
MGGATSVSTTNAGLAQMAIAMERDGRLIGIFDLILAWIDRSRQRAQLASVDLSIVKDVGISLAEVEAECRKHFWQR